MPNIEIKARYGDLSKARRIAESLHAKHVGVEHQLDTYFRTPKGRLKLRESSRNGASLIPYVRPSQTGPKRSEYAVIPVKDAVSCKSLLAEILGIEVVVDKKREVFLIDNVRVHLDEVAGLGTFFEFEAVYEDPAVEEAERRKFDGLMEAFEIKKDDLLEGSYRELKLASAAGAGRTAKNHA